jgi:hypothetical protein
MHSIIFYSILFYSILFCSILLRLREMCDYKIIVTDKKVLFDMTMFLKVEK